MHRIDTPDAHEGLYRDGNPALGILATYVDAAAMNALQEEIANAILAEGIDLVKGDNTQLGQAIEAAVLRVAAPLIVEGFGPRYVNAATALNRRQTLVDSSAGSFALLLPANPDVGWSTELIDANASWGAHPVTLQRNGKTIMGLAEDLVLNKSDQRFSIWWRGDTWRLL